MIKAISLYYQEGSSDKEYHVQIIEGQEGFLVNFQYGRRGAALKNETKTKSPVSEAEANKIYNSLVKSKMAKGYTPSETGKVFSNSEGVKDKGKVYEKTPQLLNVITDEELLEMLADDNYLAQEKFDGERRMIDTRSEALGVNKKGLIVDLPDLLKKAIPKDLILDGELVGETYYCFDVLFCEGMDLTSLPQEKRQEKLESIKSMFGENVIPAKSAKTKAQKEKLLKKLKEDQAEGIVLKDKKAAYNSGRPSSGGSALKYKFYKTATTKVTAVSKAKRSVEMSVLDGNNWIFIGKVTVPSNQNVPEVGSYIEVRYLYALEGGSLFQPTLLSERTDVDDSDAKASQLVFKKE